MGVGLSFKVGVKLGSGFEVELWKHTSRGQDPTANEDLVLEEFHIPRGKC